MGQCRNCSNEATTKRNHFHRFGFHKIKLCDKCALIYDYEDLTDKIKLQEDLDALRDKKYKKITETIVKLLDK